MYVLGTCPDLKGVVLESYYLPSDYQVSETDILAAFRMTPQPGVPAVWI